MPPAAPKAPLSFRGVHLYTLGHSTRSLDELIALLQHFNITHLIDIRTVPRSRKNPQFNRDTLPASLRRHHVRYVHLSDLGGLRRTRPDSPNTGWRNASFRGYADYMLTPEFEQGLAKLRALCEEGRACIMCAEAVPWRCHRSLVADAVTVRGGQVEHITSATHASPHRMTRFARVEGARVTYPAEALGAVATEAPFHLEATVRVLQRRPQNLVDQFHDETYARLLRTAEGLVLVELVNRGGVDDPDLHVSTTPSELASATQAEVERVVHRVLGLDVDPAPLAQLGELEPRLLAAATALRGMRPPRYPELFETCANVIPFQQVSLDAGVAIVSRLVERFGEALEHRGRRYYAFPEAGAIAGAKLADLRACGLSERKAEALKALARVVESGSLREEELLSVDSATAAKRLAELPGIGAWSANLVLLRGLGRLDAFPPGDAGIARGLGALLGTKSSATLERLVKRAGEKRGYLYFCTLGAALLKKGLIHAAPERAASSRGRSRKSGRAGARAHVLGTFGA